MGATRFSVMAAVALALVCGCAAPAEDEEDTAASEGAATLEKDEIIERDVAASPQEILNVFLNAKKFSDVIKNTSDVAAFPDSDGTDAVKSETTTKVTMTTERFYPLGKLGPAKWKIVATLPKRVAADGSFTMTVDFIAADSLHLTADGRLVWKFEPAGDGDTAVWTETIKAGFSATGLIQWGHGRLMDGAAKNMGALAAKARTTK